LTTRDEQIAAIRRRKDGLDSDRLETYYPEITEAYESESIVDRLAQVVEEHDRTPSDYRVLTNSEARNLRQFNDNSYRWEYFCKQLGRSVAIGERRYIFEELQRVPLTGAAISLGRPQFDEILVAASQLSAEGYNPDVLCAPIGLSVPFHLDSKLKVDWTNREGKLVVTPGGPALSIYWSSRLAPLDRFVILDSSKTRWRVKLDAISSHRLTVAIGKPEAPPGSVMFLAETVAKFEILDSLAIRAVPVEAEAVDEEIG